MKNNWGNTIEQWIARLLRGGIRYRLFLLVTLIMLPFVALLTFGYYQRYDTRRTYALQTELEVAHGLSVAFTAYLNGVKRQNLSLGHAIRILPSADKEQIRRLLITVKGHNTAVRNISWINPSGEVLVSSSSDLRKTNISHLKFIRDLIDGENQSVSDLSEGGITTARPTVFVATAIRDLLDGELKGIIAASIEPTLLSRNALTQKRYLGAVMALFDSQGRLVYRSDNDAPEWDERSGWKDRDPLLTRVVNHGSPTQGLSEIVHSNTGSHFIEAIVPVPATSWIALARQPAKTAFAKIRYEMTQDFLLGTVVIVLAFGFAYLLSYNISIPLLRLSDDAHIMAEGKIITRNDIFAPEEVRKLRDNLIGITTSLLLRTSELRESESSFRTVVENVYDGISIHDLNGRFVYVNYRWLNMFLLTPEEVDHITIQDISAGPMPVEELLPMWREILSGETKFFDWRSRRPSDGTLFDAEIFLCAIRFKGQDMIMACVRDITERKIFERELQQSKDELETRVQDRTKELAQAFEELKNQTEQRLAAVENLRRQEQLLIQQSRLAAMGEMMVNIAHQWRQPLNVVGLIVQGLSFSSRMGAIDKQEIETQTAKAMELILHMSRTIDDFRDFFSPDKAKEQFSTKEVVDKVLSLLDGDLQILQVKVDTESEENECCYVEGFRNEFLQVVLNIVTNSRDALRDRKITDPKITIRLFKESGHSVLTIADNAGGIDEEIMDKIFDPYFTTKGPDKGTGIGLFMSKTIIEKHMGGTLRVKNTPDGAEFRIQI